MKDARVIMGMPIDINVDGGGESARIAIEDAFAFLTSVDEQFSTYKDTSEISRINRGECKPAEASTRMRDIFARAERARLATDGYFDIKRPDGSYDPSGVVKGWAIRETAKRLAEAGFKNYFVNAGGDVASAGVNEDGAQWSVGVENPFNRAEIVKVVYPRGRGVATSGSYIRGAHIYDPHDPERALDEVVSLTVIGPDVEIADVAATAAFAMGRRGLSFIENQPGFEGYLIDAKGDATITSGFEELTRA